MNEPIRHDPASMGAGIRNLGELIAAYDRAQGQFESDWAGVGSISRGEVKDPLSKQIVEVCHGSKDMISSIMQELGKPLNQQRANVADAKSIRDVTGDVITRRAGGWGGKH